MLESEVKIRVRYKETDNMGVVHHSNYVNYYEVARTEMMRERGLTYKENVDDVRESPTLQLVETMKEHLAGTPKCYDPMVHTQVVDNQYQDFDAFLKDIDLMVIMVHHDHLDQSASLVQNKVIFDTRNCGINWPENNRVLHL